jgi:ABC-type dipeptide/oligopeptide/nickel transport system permease subunit
MMALRRILGLWRRVRPSALAIGGLGLLVAFLAVALLAPAIARHDPKTLFEPLLPPSPRHPLGTDDIGHDLFSELCCGARFSLSIGLLSALLSTVFGGMLGLLAGYDERSGYLIMRVVDVFLAVPRFPLIVLMAAFLRPGAGTLLLFFTLFGWPRAARLVRAQVLGERSKGYVEAAQLIGARGRRILLRHLLPGTVPIALPRFIAEFQHVIIAESGLSFLGLGNPLVKSWGTMLSFASRYPTIYITDLWVRWALPPGLCITLVVLALALVSYELETWAHPRLRAWHGQRAVEAADMPTACSEQAVGRGGPPEREWSA